MKDIFICCTSKDIIYKINIEDLAIEQYINLSKNLGEKIGPHGLCLYENKLICANNYSNSITIIDRNTRTIISNYYIGKNCNDIINYKNYAYVICSDCNNIVVFNMDTLSIKELLPCQNMPYSIDIYKPKKIMVTTNMESDSISIFNIDNSENVNTVKVGPYPTKVKFSIDGNFIFVCESNLGSNAKGSISVISLKNMNVINRIKVGNMPMDMDIYDNYGIVSNFGEGSISLIDFQKGIEIEKIIVGGMPKEIIKNSDYFYVSDYYNDCLIKINLIQKSKKAISIGGEPNGMILA